MSPKGRKIAQRIAKRLRVKLDFARPVPGKDCYAYDGKTIAARGRSVSNVLHDLAHFAVASPRQRRLPEFGLGSAPDLFAEPCIEHVRESTGTRLEEQASLLGIYWEQTAGLDWRTTRASHGWDRDNSSESARRRQLRRKGLVP